ncbi:MAG: hypothetical protein EZS28_020179 [Streblomastix strix]|uniref:DDE-1 domain-containing protein n=1 Tax=Streblomastix strix TaxID=222440 RepID=A0A5J4VP28_9EUKA|nr:MAG: hypothetical protein EZS28_020179 [Streblomastix strix]
MHIPNAPATVLCNNYDPHFAVEIQAKLAASNIRLLNISPHSTHATQSFDLITFSVVKGDLSPRKGAQMPKSKIEKVKLVYQVLKKHTNSSTNENAFRIAGYPAVTENKMQKVKIDESKLISNYSKFMNVDEKEA